MPVVGLLLLVLLPVRDGRVVKLLEVLCGEREPVEGEATVFVVRVRRGGGPRAITLGFVVIWQRPELLLPGLGPPNGRGAPFALPLLVRMMLGLLFPKFRYVQ